MILTRREAIRFSLTFELSKGTPEEKIQHDK